MDDVSSDPDSDCQLPELRNDLNLDDDIEMVDVEGQERAEQLQQPQLQQPQPQQQHDANSESSQILNGPVATSEEIGELDGETGEMPMESENPAVC